MLLIQNATNNWTKSWLFLPALYTGNQQSCLLENCDRNARIYNKLMLYETRALQQAYAAQTGLLH